MVNMGAALNDLLLVNRLLISRLDAENEPLAGHEAQYLLRTSIGHLWELALCIKAWSSTPAVVALIDSLSQDERRKLNDVLAISKPSDPVSKTIVHLRNAATWHYATPSKAKNLRWALREAAQSEGAIEFGKTYANYRASYVDEVLVQLTVQLFPGDPEEATRELLTKLSSLTTGAIQFLDALCQAYFTEERGCVIEVDLASS